MEIAGNKATVQLITDHPAVYETLQQLRSLFTAAAGDDWIWGNNAITAALYGKDIRDQHDWPGLIAFFKQRMMSLDAFWLEVREVISD